MLRDQLRISGLGFLTAFVLGVATPAPLVSAATPGPECLVEVQEADESTAGETITCNDCDQSCDADGVATANKSCQFKLRLCLNADGTGCPLGVKGRKVKASGHCGPVGKLFVTPNGSNSVCGAFTTIKVKTKKNGKRPGKCKIRVSARSDEKPSKVDLDKVMLVCNPSPGTCAASSTTTTVISTQSTTTTTIGGPCGDCCQFTKLRFTTGLPSIGGGGCGNVKDSNNTTLMSIDCGGLYTGGGGGTLPLPNVVPDMGSNVTKVQNCSGGQFQIAPTVEADIGGTNPHRSCTSAGIADPDYPACVGGTRNGLPCVNDADCPTGTCTGTMPGCLFGPPLPIPNSTFAGASVCVVNRIATSASGSGTCATGATSLSLPLASDLYLESDLLDGSSPNRPAVSGIQPCPLCKAGAPPGGSCAAANCCWGGPKHDQACTPGSSASLGDASPTSHDCPPPPGALGSAYIGALPIPFGLTTDSTGTDPNAHRVGTFMNGQEVICGFCGGAFSPIFKNPPVPCTTNTDCTGVTGCPGTTACGTCRQRTSGAFGTASSNPGAEHEITLFGSSGNQCLADGATHPATLVSAFCIPPAYNATVDANGDLPGPGATALIGQAQLLP